MGPRRCSAAAKFRCRGLDGLTQRKIESFKNKAHHRFRETRMAISLKVNGVTRSVEAEPDTPLLYVLRNDLELNGPKFGCGMVQCAACTVLINGAAVRSCAMPIA